MLMSQKERTREIIESCNFAQETIEVIDEMELEKAQCTNPNCDALFMKGKRKSKQVFGNYWIGVSNIRCTNVAVEISNTKETLGRLSPETLKKRTEELKTKLEELNDEAEDLGITK